MRDDIHKSCPVSQAWRSFLKHCAREADRKIRAEAAMAALLSDCRREIDPKFVAHLGQQCNDPQGKLFENPIGDYGRARLGTNGGVLAKEITSNLCRREAQGEKGAVAVKNAIKDAVAARIAAESRAIKGHLWKHAGDDASNVVSVVDRECAAIDVNSVAEKILSADVFSESAKPAKRSVDLDEDLR